MRPQRILVVDGHDASGKTTLARRLAAVLGAEYLRPFGGDVGARLLALAASDPEGATQHSMAAVASAADAATRNVLVYDRHWMTVCTLVPERWWSRWLPIPRTALCWADLNTTRTRLAARSEHDEFADEHERYLKLYRDLAERFGCMVVRTDQGSEDASLELLLRWSNA
jgi:thymidylate kinase